MYAALIDKYNQVVTSAEGDVIYTTANPTGKETEAWHPPLLRDSNNNSWKNGVIKIESINLIGEPGT